MTTRITERDLKILADRLNEMTGSPKEPYSKHESGEFRANIGNYHISYAYGGACLHRMHNTGGGVSTPLVSYHTPKRDLYNRMHAFIDGIEFERNKREPS